MLTLKIRVPYKEGNPETVMDILSDCFIQSSIIQWKIEDGTLVFKFDSVGPMPNYTADLRLLELTES